MHRRVEDVVTRILKSNEDIKAVSERDWKISVVDDYTTVNARVIPERNSSNCTLETVECHFHIN